MHSLLSSLGCEVIGINLEQSGRFAHPPEPIPENLGQLCDKVKQENADIGIAVDPDVDRCVLIDETGTLYLNGVTRFLFFTYFINLF